MPAQNGRNALVRELKPESNKEKRPRFATFFFLVGSSQLSLISYLNDESYHNLVFVYS